MTSCSFHSMRLSKHIDNGCYLSMNAMISSIESSPESSWHGDFAAFARKTLFHLGHAKETVKSLEGTLPVS